MSNPTEQMHPNHWRTSSHSGGNGDCVQVNQSTAHVVGIRDSKNPRGGHLAVSGPAFAALTSAVCAGRAV